MDRIIVLLSGGLDSTACLHKAVQEGYEAWALHVDYGQPQRVQERRVVKRLCASLGVPLRVARAVLSSTGGGGYIPARNLVLLSMAANYAEAVEATELWAGILPGGVCSKTTPVPEFGKVVWFPATGESGIVTPMRGVFLKHAHNVVTLTDEDGELYETSAEDLYETKEACLKAISAELALPNPSYPDTTIEFISTFNEVLKAGTSADDGLRLVAPFRDKVSVWRFLQSVGVRVEETWSCLAGGKKPCGVCKACADIVAVRAALGA